MKKINQLMLNGMIQTKRIGQRAVRILKDRSGDQITGWLIVILLVVVVGAFFLKTYQESIIEIWNGIVNKAKTTFGI